MASISPSKSGRVAAALIAGAAVAAGLAWTIREHRPALPDDPRFRERVRIREISISSPRAIADFDGSPTPHVDVARRYGVKFAPTVLFL
ncbi:MAG TPA: hypothetical protein PLP92_12330, partial [Rhodocyclaceae bacterium]|nr:hypothetical protein [Rhodocyclaceae bacterium]